MIQLHPLSRFAAGYGLGLPNGPPKGPPDSEGWVTVCANAAEHRLVGLLAAAYRDGAIVLDKAQAEWLADRHLAASTLALEVEAMALQAIELLTEHGIETRLLKGLAVAHLDYGDASCRTFNDADLLVRSDDIPVAASLLARHGYHRDLPERRRDFDRRFGKDVTLGGPGMVEIDLHRLFAVGLYGQRQRLGDLWVEAETFDLAGHVVAALCPEDRFLHACFASVLGVDEPRVALLRDVVQILTGGRIRAALLQERIERWRCAAVVTAALRCLERALGGLPASPVVDELVRAPCGRFDRLALRAYPAFGGSFGLAVLSGAFGLGVRAAPRYVHGLATPSRPYRRARVAAGRRPESHLLFPDRGSSRTSRRSRLLRR